MTPDRILILLLGAACIGFIVWLFWLRPSKGTTAPLNSAGYQELLVRVKGGYTPDTIVVQRGKPVRLNFRREESTACSELVRFEAFGKSAQLPEGKSVPVEFQADAPGEYEFTCQAGMYRGRLIVE